MNARSLRIGGAATIPLSAREKPPAGLGYCLLGSCCRAGSGAREGGCPLEGGGCRAGSGSREDMTITWFDAELAIFRQDRPFGLDPIAYRRETGVPQRDASRFPTVCLFRTVVLPWSACLCPNASHRCPLWSPWVAENHAGTFKLYHEKESRYGKQPDKG
jgi:hypothetical protein